MNTTYNIIGIGVGPSNLSLASLLSDVPASGLFFEKKKDFNWHPCILIEKSKMQNSYLRDIVSLINPRNKYTYLNYLHSQKRLYEFINADFDFVYRKEFTKYLSWVANDMTNLNFDERITDVTWKDDLFVVHTSRNRSFNAQHIVLGTGKKPYWPEPALAVRSPKVFHAADYLDHKHLLAGKSVAIVGGGQTGAEVFEDLLTDSSVAPSNISWVSSRSNFLPLDDSPFVNEYFSPDYITAFLKEDHAVKENIFKMQILSSDGISLSTLKNIYQALYYNAYLQDEGKSRKVRLYPGNQMTRMQSAADGTFSLTLENKMTKKEQELAVVDYVLLSTGFCNSRYDFLKNIYPLLNLDSNDQFIVNEDYSVQSTLSKNKIYVQNGAQRSHGISDANLSTMAWRSAVIINSMLGFNFYNTCNNNIFIHT